LVHTGAEDKLKLLDLSLWKQMSSPKNWQELLLVPDIKDELAALQSKTRNGWPMVDESYLAQLEVRLGRRLRPHPNGRPRKNY
jgi:hypothetical protein